MNSTVGVEKSILMDVVPRYFRAKVSAVEGFTTFSWTGSAVLGGILVEARRVAAANPPSPRGHINVTPFLLAHPLAHPLC